VAWLTVGVGGSAITQTEETATSESRATILIVDDDPHIRSMLAEYFQRQGFSVLEAPDAENGRVVVEEQRPNIALVDLHLPGENGLSFCKYAIEEKSIPIIMLTGDEDSVERVIGLEVGADDYISKPFDLREVLARTRTVLRRTGSVTMEAASSNPIEALLVRSVITGRTERFLLTILFCDIVESTRKAEELGDQIWTTKLRDFEELCRKAVGNAPGLTLKWLGDGLMAVFTTPGRALRAAGIMHEVGRRFDLELRVGVHCGECERRGDDLAGIAVHIAARVLSCADAGQTIVTSTVKEVMTGSDIVFEDRGKCELKGVADPWHLYEARMVE